MIKNVRFYFSLFFVLCLSSTIAIATPSLKIKDTNLNCDSYIASKGYSGCTLSIDLIIEDYEYLDKYSNLTYNVECEANFDYLSKNHYVPMTNRENDYIKIWGTNRRKTLDLRTSFWSIDPVYKVNVSGLSCRIKDIY